MSGWCADICFHPKQHAFWLLPLISVSQLSALNFCSTHERSQSLFSFRSQRFSPSTSKSQTFRCALALPLPTINFRISCEPPRLFHLHSYLASKRNIGT